MIRVSVTRQAINKMHFPSFFFGHNKTVSLSLSSCATGLAAHMDSQPKDVLSIGKKGSKKTLQKPEWLKASPPSGGKYTSYIYLNLKHESLSLSSLLSINVPNRMVSSCRL